MPNDSTSIHLNKLDDLEFTHEQTESLRISNNSKSKILAAISCTKFLKELHFTNQDIVDILLSSVDGDRKLLALIEVCRFRSQMIIHSEVLNAALTHDFDELNDFLKTPSSYCRPSPMNELHKRPKKHSADINADQSDESPPKKAKQQASSKSPLPPIHYAAAAEPEVRESSHQSRMPQDLKLSSNDYSRYSPTRNHLNSRSPLPEIPSDPNLQNTPFRSLKETSERILAARKHNFFSPIELPPVSEMTKRLEHWLEERIAHDLLAPQARLAAAQEELVEPQEELVEPQEELVEPREELVEPREELVEPQEDGPVNQQPDNDADLNAGRLSPRGIS